MTPSPKPSAVLYAKHLSVVCAFYEQVVGLRLMHTEPGHVVLESPAFQLVLQQVPAAIAAGIEIGTPPERRSETPIKLVFLVGSIAAARALAPGLGGELNPPEKEWTYADFLVCDGHDPEGNVLQFREYLH